MRTSCFSSTIYIYIYTSILYIYTDPRFAGVLLVEQIGRWLADLLHGAAPRGAADGRHGAAAARGAGRRALDARVVGGRALGPARLLRPRRVRVQRLFFLHTGAWPPARLSCLARAPRSARRRARAARAPTSGDRELVI